MNDEENLILCNSHVLIAVSEGSKIFLQQNPSVLNYGCWLARVDLCDVCIMVCCVHFVA